MSETHSAEDRPSQTWRRTHDSIVSARRAIGRATLSQGPPITVAIPFPYSKGWAAQTSFLHSVASSMSETGDAHALLIVLNLSGETGRRALASDVGDLAVDVDPATWHNETDRAALLSNLGVDCLLNLFRSTPRVDGIGHVGWIPDFQHFRMPQFFSAEEILDRDRAFAAIIDGCDRILLSSYDAERDCVRFRPAASGKTRVHPFPSSLIYRSLPGPSTPSAVQKYHLPAKFVLVANQFWAHKNHLYVVEAARLLANRGLRVPFVLTGLPSDSRDPSNSVVSKVLQAIATSDLRDCVIPLAQVPYPDLIDLLRHAALVLQPSSFEGWSTTVEDSKALGRPVACSAISVHREQAPGAVGFFDPARPDQLAELIEGTWSSLSPGPDPASEVLSLQNEKQFAQEFGQALWRTCAEATAEALS